MLCCNSQLASVAVRMQRRSRPARQTQAVLFAPCFEIRVQITPVLLYYITDRHQFPGTEAERRRALLARIGEAARAGIDYIQLREKDLPAGALERLAHEAVKIVREGSATARLLVNSRIDVALASEAEGVHLTSTDICASDARVIADLASRQSSTPRRSFLVAASCHSVAEVRMAESQGADFVVLAPIFEKPGTNVSPLGLATLTAAAGSRPATPRVEAGENRACIPVFALGGVTLDNAHACVRAGAAGVAGIRIFQQGDLAETVRRLRAQTFRVSR